MTSYPPVQDVSATKGLSAKAKGKLRAQSPSRTGDEQQRGMVFNVRFTEGEPDLLNLFVEEGDTIRIVKQRIRELRPNLVIQGKPRRLRLIQLGRLLTDGIQLVSWTRTLLERREKALKNQKESGESLLEELIGGDAGEEEEGKGKERREEVWLHCSVGAIEEIGRAHV